MKADFYSLTDYIFVKTGMTFLYLLVEFITSSMVDFLKFLLEKKNCFQSPLYRVIRPLNLT